MGVGPIPWTAISNYATANNFDEEQRSWLMYLIPRLDNVYMRHVNEQKSNN